MTMLDTTAASLGADTRAFVLLKSGRRLDLLDPDPAGLDRRRPRRGSFPHHAMGWGFPMGSPLSVAQHSLTVLAIREAEGPRTASEGLRELLHDAAEFMLGWDCIAPLKAQLGAPFRELEARLQAAVEARYRLPSWTAEDYAKHKQADRLAAASEAFHVVGWSRTDMVEALGIAIPPLLDDPLPPHGFARWEAVAAGSRATSLHGALPRACGGVPVEPVALPKAGPFEARRTSRGARISGDLRSVFRLHTRFA